MLLGHLGVDRRGKFRCHQDDFLPHIGRRLSVAKCFDFKASRRLTGIGF